VFVRVLVCSELLCWYEDLSILKLSIRLSKINTLRIEIVNLLMLLWRIFL
jgi:hypothetical protein